MILGIAVFNLRPGVKRNLKRHSKKASAFIQSADGYQSHHLQHCIEKDNQYVLLVNWRTADDHTIGFRNSLQYQEWRKLIHHFFEVPPDVSHGVLIYQNPA
jgi:heme-degrading monooxygenase HmoA